VDFGDLSMEDIAYEMSDTADSTFLASKWDVSPSQEVREITPEIAAMLEQGNEP
jgi:hypothetical protein